MAKMDEVNLRRFALAGAEKRLEELNAEAAQILRMFPQLRARGRGRAPAAADSPAAPTKTRRRRRISAEGRRRIAEAQKARWARQRAEAAKATGRKHKSAS